MSDLILAHDLGTTGNKATLIDTTGKPVASVFEGYGTAYPRPNWAEQEAGDWQRALIHSTRRLLAQAGIDPQRVAVVSFSGHMQGALLLDEEGRPIRPAVIWADQRATDQAAWIAEAAGANHVYRLTGHRVSAAYTAAKVLWIKQHQPEVWHRTRWVLQTKDYAAWLLTGVVATDYSDASGTQLFDLDHRRWSSDLLNALGLRADIFPPAHPSTTLIGRVTPQAAELTGLAAGTPVVIGGGDGACATVGSGAVQEGDAYTYIGSSSWMAFSARKPLLDPAQRIVTFAHLDAQLCFSLGNMQAAGGAFDWLDRLFNCQPDAGPGYGELDAMAASVPPGAGGVLCLPYLLGERSPHWNPHARAAFIGLSMAHGRAEMARAVLEGVAFNLRWILDVLREQGAHIQRMCVIGGGAKSAVWRQILADIYGMPLLRPHLDATATALGAAIAGGIGVGLFKDFSIVRQIIPLVEAEKPAPENAYRYAALYPLFQRSYAALKPVFDHLVASIQSTSE
ncbi:MAG: xylulokinase [Anaerolineae bacterium]|nr:xylulokinase [Thermoflexales bacterium]MDW8408309.1 xylulokinase [Anaerolineae bacterium]